MLVSAMRTLLRHTETGLYLQGPEKWTASPDGAYDFRFIDRARKYVRIWELQSVEFAFVFDDSEAISTFSLEMEMQTAA